MRRVNTDILLDYIKDWFNDKAQELYYKLRDEYEWLTSDEAVADSLEANEIYEHTTEATP